ncbi:bifunctional protein-serine/threonine kinase/phosphatase, partial [Acinetobacter baumannii]|nr:bifunctional protein-serine/threonine kinase/phosphatase [Acinetobacter baumannii]
SDLELAVNTLVNAAHLAGSQDNASALLVRIDQLGAATLGDALVQLQQWPLPPPLKVGQTFEGWQVQSVLAQSRQSLLYRVHDAQGQPWLLKTLPLRCDDTEAAQALLSEEWFLRRVAGRAFPEVHAASGRQHLYYVMREYAGQTLAQLFQQQGPLPLAQWQSIAERLL